MDVLIVIGIRFSVMVIQRLLFVWEEHDQQPDYDYVLETKEYIDKKMKNYW